MPPARHTKKAAVYGNQVKGWIKDGSQVRNSFLATSAKSASLGHPVGRLLHAQRFGLRFGLSALAALVTSGCLSSCACGRLGALVARQTLTPTADVLEVAGWGVLLRPTKYDGGVSIGYRRATYIYSRRAGDFRPVGQSLHWGWVPGRAELPFFIGTRELGVAFQTVAGRSMLHAGYVDQGLCFAAEADQSLRGLFRYRQSHPERTVLVINAEPEQSSIRNL